ncbi:DUF1499 domain-containing protein [Ketobacter sp. MCCC 1A13808]|uniref:DUF1499 domain-containing protein n=1 Tax=Ketobacter sp. MCCC 1A13808 TaxID=2602738 RepID=UPI000F2A6DEF|nr:DUF1499 domain-containing protein [Ketobacter sp. MCCC 1A13808]MVF14666.1 DUF1499 domain-containing protein [Ketobacter sp. MCCC 1A13808]RLP53964.1 MAG: DUF1499 domain-containing protein [Ketobacter sp.]
MSIVVKLFRLLPVLLIVALAVAWSFPLLAFGARKELWSFQTAFFLLAGSAVTAAVLLAVSGTALLMAIRRKNDRAKHRAILLILVLSIPVGILFNFGIKASQAPVIYDISTDWENPPDFLDLEGQRPKDANPLQTAAEVSALQSEFYPDIVSKTVAGDPLAVFEKVQKAADEMDWKLFLSDPSQGRLQAVDKTFWFGFKDDVVVRVKAVDSAHSIVDVRSVSRVGKGDIGKNAERINHFLSLID